MIGTIMVLVFAQIGAVIARRVRLSVCKPKYTFQQSGHSPPGVLQASIQTRRKNSNPVSPAMTYIYDGTYIYYDEWADIEPLVIRDKGVWKTSDGLVELSSDPDVTWDSGTERKYIVIHRQSRPHEILLIGTDRDLSNFEETAKDEAEIDLLVFCKERSRSITSGQAARIKQDLMRQAWQPEYFRADSNK